MIAFDAFQPPTQPVVVSVATDGLHRFSKVVRPAIRLLAGLGVEGDAHCGALVRHRSRVARDPTQPNLRQVHLFAAELLDELATKGLQVLPGQMGENLTVRGLDVLGLPQDTILHIGQDAVVQVTGLRNPCAQIEAYKTSLLAEMLSRDAKGQLIRKAGIMGIVLCGGQVVPGDAIRVVLPSGPRLPLKPV